jgi:uncharacterized membrane protein
MGGWGSLGLLGWLGPVFGLVLFVGLIGLLVLGAVWLVRRTGQPAAAVPQSGAQPLEIARRRLAAGEITPDEFEELRGRLR